MKKEQVLYLHLLRILAMLMVIMLHSITPYIVNPAYYATRTWYMLLIINALSRAGVPLFFMISGYLLLSDDATLDIKTFYKKRLPKILIPLVLWNVIYFIFYFFLDHRTFRLTDLLAQMLECGTSYHFWYLYTLFGIYLIAPFLKRIVNTCSFGQLVWFEVLLCFCGTIRPLINKITPVYIFWFDPLFNGYIGYFVLGYLLGRAQFSKKRLFSFLGLGLLGVLTSATGNHAASSSQGVQLVYNGGYDICYFFIASALFFLFKTISSGGGGGQKAPIFKSLSKATFGMYIVHVGVMDIIDRYFMIDASPLISSMYLFALTTFFSAALSYTLGKIKYVF